MDNNCCFSAPGSLVLSQFLTSILHHHHPAAVEDTKSPIIDMIITTTTPSSDDGIMKIRRKEPLIVPHHHLTTIHEDPQPPKRKRRTPRKQPTAGERMCTALAYSYLMVGPSPAAPTVMRTKTRRPQRKPAAVQPTKNVCTAVVFASHNKKKMIERRETF